MCKEGYRVWLPTPSLFTSWIPARKSLPRSGAPVPLAGVAGKVIGLLENRKYHADAFLQELHKVLEQEYEVKRVVYATKFSYSAPCAEETINALVAECDAIIHGIAD